jgi:hypothetical protein
MNTIKLNTIGERPIKKGGASGSGGGGLTYFDLTSEMNYDAIYQVLDVSCVAKYKENDWTSLIQAPAVAGDLGSTCVAIGIDLNCRVNDVDEQFNYIPKMTTLGEFLSRFFPEMVAWPRITEEEFYDTSVPTYKVVIYGGRDKEEKIGTYEYVQGMTWQDWVGSRFNTDSYTNDIGSIKLPGREGMLYVREMANLFDQVSPAETIESWKDYVIF